MKITIKPEVFRKFAQLKVAFISMEGINNKSKAQKANHLLSEVQKVVLLSFNKDTAKSHLLIAPWKVAEEEFGKPKNGQRSLWSTNGMKSHFVKAKHYNTSVELLLQKALRKQKLQAKDTMTALLRYLALKHIVPFGADDPTKINGDIAFELKKGDLQYRDAKKILGKKLDYWKNTATSLKPSSTSALVHFEFLPPVNPAKQKEIVAEAVELIQAFCGGKAKVAVLDKKKNLAVI